MGWNFGKPLQSIFSRSLWYDVVLLRLLTPAGALPAVCILLVGLFAAPRYRHLLLIFLGLALVPLFLFSSVHHIHTYYQSANHIFLLLALAFAASSPAFDNRWMRLGSILGVFVLMASFYWQFFGTYYDSTQARQHGKLRIGHLVNSRTPTDSAILVFGDDWNPSFAFHSRRKALYYPDWAQKQVGLSADQVLHNPGRFLGDVPLGAIISDETLPWERLKSACALQNIEASESVGKWRIYFCSTAPDVAAPAR